MAGTIRTEKPCPLCGENFQPGFVGTDSFRYRRSNPDDANDRFNMEILYRVTVQ